MLWLMPMARTKPNPVGKPEPSELTDDALEMIAQRFRVLGEANRLRLIRCLEDGELSVSELVSRTSLTQANVSRHLQTLTQAGILGRRRDGVNVLYRIADPGIFELCGHVCGSLQADMARKAGAFIATPAR